MRKITRGIWSIDQFDDLLLAALMLCALSLVSAQHQARTLFVALERAQAMAVHGGVVARDGEGAGTAQAGMLVSLRGVALLVETKQHFSLEIC